MSHEQSLRTALALVERGILTPRAGRFLSHFATTGLFCEALQMSGGEIGIVWRDRWYTPAEFNALADDRYPPTVSDVTVAITAFAAAEPVEDGNEEGDSEPTESAEPAPDPDKVVEGLRSGYGKDAEAEARLEAMYQASSQRTDGEGGLVWTVIIGGALFLAVMVWAFFNGAWR